MCHCCTAEAAHATAEAAQATAKAAKATADAEVQHLNLLSGPAGAAAESAAPADGAAVAAATVTAPQITQIIAGFMALLTQMIQDNRCDIQQYVQTLATHQAECSAPTMC